ncbi:MAG: DUF3365 domain-containing protein [Proteobacteria bacterium]|nr:DUF3365 domain-containing protein [Pseudomonadota bacterium]
MKTPYKINTRLFLSIAFLVFCSAVALIAITNWQMKKYAVNSAKEEAMITLNRNLSIHTYFSHQLKPVLFKKLGPMKMTDYFDPIWMSSTYAVREIDKYFKSITDRKYYYKECAINARSPENEADAFEKSFIKILNNNPDIKESKTIREFENKRFLVVLKRGEVMEESCLRCHSNPDTAPIDMVKQYGASRSFNRSVDEVVSAISIRIPVEDVFAQINKLSFHLSAILLLILAALFGSITYLTKSFIFAPLNYIREKSVKIVSNPEHLGEHIEYPEGQEFFDLVSSFNEMSSKLRKDRDHLENLVEQRTKDLKQLNEQLEQKIKEAEEEINKRKLAEEALQSSKDKYQRLVEELSSQFMIYSFTLDGTLMYASPGIKSIFGISPEKAIGKNVFDNIINWNPEEYELGRKKFADLLSGQEVKGIELSFLHPDGTQRTILDTPHIIRDSNGAIQFIEGISEDITERKQVEKALKDSEKRYRTLIEKMTVGFALHEIIYDEDGKPYNCRFLEANKAFEKITGIEANKLIGNTVLEALPQTESYWFDTYGKVALTGEPVHFETYVKEIDSYYDVVAYSPQEGQFATLMSNITKKKKMENDRKKLINELQEALENIKTLNGLLPICAQCKKIRDDKGYWNQIETYIENHSDALFSHGLCPDCMDKLYGKEPWYKKMKEDENE